MATVIQSHRSNVPAAEPANLEPGELAVHYTEKKLWVGDGTANPVLLLDRVSEIENPPVQETPDATEIEFDGAGSGTNWLTSATTVEEAIIQLAASVLSDYKIEVYENGTLPGTRNSNTIYLEKL